MQHENFLRFFACRCPVRFQRGARAFLLAALASLAAPGFAQNTYPNKVVRVIVPYAAGASGDLLGRLIGSKLSEAWGRQVYVDNRAGAAGMIGAGLVAHAAPDGYTLLLGTDAQMAISPHIQKSMPYDASKDFAPVVQAAFIEFVLTVHPSIPADTLPELVKFLKANPGKYSYATHGIGSSAHLTMEWLKSIAGIDILHVPYKGSSQILPDLLGGTVHMSYTGVPQTMPLVNEGKLKAIALGSAQRLRSAPGVPTIAETYPGFESNASWNFFAPAGTPRDVIAKLNTDINHVLALPDVAERLNSQGLIPIGGSPEQLGARMKADSLKWGKIIRMINLKPE
jgi:tripartite-type tricarboxylate transporter receptor subunit TctC